MKLEIHSNSTSIKWVTRPGHENVWNVDRYLQKGTSNTAVITNNSLIHFCLCGKQPKASKNKNHNPEIQNHYLKSILMYDALYKNPRRRCTEL